MIGEEEMITNTIIHMERRGLSFREAAAAVIADSTFGLDGAEYAALQDALAAAAHSRRVLNMVWGSVQARRGLRGGIPT